VSMAAMLARSYVSKDLRESETLRGVERVLAAPARPASDAAWRSHVSVVLLELSDVEIMSSTRGDNMRLCIELPIGRPRGLRPIELTRP
jgi:hypothetical protein